METEATAVRACFMVLPTGHPPVQYNVQMEIYSLLLHLWTPFCNLNLVPLFYDMNDSAYELWVVVVHQLEG